MARTRQYVIWANMKRRCNSYDANFIKYYRSKGIHYPKKWETFEGFWEDMANGYANNLSIDRIDGNKSYSKENCRWATPSQQMSNTSQVKLITWKGITLNMSQWARKLGIGHNTISYRLNMGWPTEKILDNRKFPSGRSSITKHYSNHPN